jgi:uncharacterized Zn finger protein
MSRYYEFFRGYTPTPPKAVEGGIKASNKRGQFTKKWWGMRWIETLESFNIGARLSRGRSYARRGQVASLDISHGRVTAKVQGTRARPYRISLDMKVFTPGQWQHIIDEIVQQPIYVAQLLGNEMPEDIETVFKKAGVTLFPNKRRDMETECSCPDWSNPCKHIAAVFYLMGEAFDRDPFLLFTLRGMERAGFMQALRNSAGEASGTADEAVSIEPEPLPIEPEPFWGHAPQGFPDLSVDTEPPLHAALPKRLGPISFWRSGQDFLQKMQGTYQQVHRQACTRFEALNGGRQGEN